jgi:hypothetical protein
MRLINTETLDFQEFYDDQAPRYAILSHRWADDEVACEDYARQLAAYRRGEPRMKGFRKVLDFCFLANREGHLWVWIDSCCIDKRSSAELSEAINSMYQWYASAECYAYLSDVRSPKATNWEEVMADFRRSVWFTRGWTLQELVAPRRIKFLSKDWSCFGKKGRFKSAITRYEFLLRQLTAYNGGSLSNEVSEAAEKLLRDEGFRDFEHVFDGLEACHRAADVADLAKALENVTRISRAVLEDPKKLSEVCVAERMCVRDKTSLGPNLSSP